MRWGSSTFTFVRPVHRLIVLHGGDIVNVSVLGLQSGNKTLVTASFPAAKSLLKCRQLRRTNARARQSGSIVCRTQAAIQTALNEQAGRLNATVAADEALLDEVTALVEWPVVLEAGLKNTSSPCLKNA